MSLRILMASLCVAGIALAPLPADAAKNPVKRDLSKEYEDLTPSEQIAIRAAAKAAYKAKKLGTLNVCADPGNMPLSNIKEEGFQNKLATLLGEAMGATAMTLRIVNLREELARWYRGLGYREVGTSPYDHRDVKHPCHFVELAKALPLASGVSMSLGAA